MSSNPVVHFEMPYEDAERVAKFYSDVFGWNMVNVGEQMGNYVTAGTAETGEDRMVTQPGAINGGFYPLGSTNFKEPSVVIQVEDLQVAIENIKAAGGEIVREPQDIPGIGLWASFTDSEGNRASILQPTGGME